MTQTPPPPLAPLPRPSSWQLVPTALKVAVLTAVLGFFVTISLSSRTETDGRLTECSFLDVGAIALGLATVVLVVSALAGQRRLSERLRMPVALLAGLSVLLVAVAAYHVVTGLGLVGGPCN